MKEGEGELQPKKGLEVVRQERGWAGHFICANRCRFRRNTLLTCSDNTEVVVSTIGLMENTKGDGFGQIGCDRYFETMAFQSRHDIRYHDIDVSKQIYFDSPWSIDEIDADDKANEMHEAVVAELTKKLKNGLLQTAILADAIGDS